MNQKILKLFIKRSLKYFLILFILIMMTIPLLLTSYHLAQKMNIDKSSQKLNEGINSFESQVKRAQEMMNLLLQKKEYQRLLLVNGFPAYENYVDMLEVQKMLAGLCMTQDNLSNAYILFKNNNIFISNYISSNNYGSVYPTFINYNQKNAQEWYDEFFDKNFLIKFLPNQNIYISQYSGSNFNGLTYLINGSNFNGIDQTSILACVFDAGYIIDSMLYKDLQQYNFFYIMDQNHHIIFEHNYANKPSLENVSNLSKITMDSKRYILLSNTSAKLGLQVVMGMPEKLFQDNVRSMTNLIIIYSVVGIIVILMLSLIFSVKEAISVGKLIEIASKSSKIKYTTRNEYSYINDAIKQISSSNEEQLHKIEILNNTIKACILENLFLYGVYTQKEEQEILSYFGRDFKYFCIALFHMHPDTPLSFSQSVQQSMIFDIENTMKVVVKNEFTTLNLSPYEVVFLIFFDESDYCDIGILKSEITAILNLASNRTASQFSIQIGLSNIVSGVKNIRQAYLQARDAIHINQNKEVSGVYVYNTPKAISQRKVFDIALLTKCYDVILIGDKKVAEQIFEDIKKSVFRLQLTEQEHLQVFFTLRQTVYNAYLEVAAGITNEEGDICLKFPDYSPMENVSDLFDQLTGLAIKLCDIVISNRRSKNDKLKDEIIACIHQNYADLNLSAEYIATEFMLSEKYVFSLMKEKTGKSLGRYIEDIRISHAERLLLTSDHSNSVISGMCGFGSENTFYRAFSRKHGVTPTIWRKNSGR